MKMSLVAFSASAMATATLIGVDPVGLAIAVKAERRDHRDNSLRQQRLEQLHIDPLDFASEEVVDTLDDAHGMGDDRVACEAARRSLAERPSRISWVNRLAAVRASLQRVGIGDPRAVQVGGCQTLFSRPAP